ncbi:MAG: hypothetical protein MUF10_06475 [Thermoanaerobaculaceae bacterium]|nr:hypothetical protein [Thermoanaerobaculaceae bacterium]
MRQFGRLTLELLFVALLYTAVGVVLGIFSAGWGRPGDLVQLLLLNLLAVVPLAFFVWKVDGTWWSIGGAAALALALLHAVVPRMELLLDRDASLIQLPWTAVNALGAAAAGVTALIMVLRPWQNGGLPPYPWPAGEPRSYLWRIPAVLAGYAVLHVLAARVGRMVFGQSTHPPLGSELLDKLALGLVVVLVAYLVAAHLGVRSPRRLAILLAVSAVVPAIGRWQALTGWPPVYLSTRVGLRLLADLGGGLLTAFLLIEGFKRSGLTRTAPAEPEPEADEQEGQEEEQEQQRRAEVEASGEPQAGAG